MKSAVRQDLPKLPSLAGLRIVLVTGLSMKEHLSSIAADIEAGTGAEIATVASHNSLYGPMVTTAGLLPGADHARALEAYRSYDLALISEAALNDQEMFIDDLTLSELRSSNPELRILPSEHVTDALLTPQLFRP